MSVSPSVRNTPNPFEPFLIAGIIIAIFGIVCAVLSMVI